MGGGPAFAGALAGHFVIAGGVQDGYAQVPVGVDVGVEEGAVELEGGRCVGVVWGEVHVGAEIAGVVEGGGVDDYEGDVPVEDVVVVELWGGLV